MIPGSPGADDDNTMSTTRPARVVLLLDLLLDQKVVRLDQNVEHRVRGDRQAERCGAVGPLPGHDGNGAAQQQHHDVPDWDAVVDAG